MSHLEVECLLPLSTLALVLALALALALTLIQIRVVVLITRVLRSGGVRPQLHRDAGVTRRTTVTAATPRRCASRSSLSYRTVSVLPQTSAGAPHEDAPVM